MFLPQLYVLHGLSWRRFALCARLGKENYCRKFIQTGLYGYMAFSVNDEKQEQILNSEVIIHAAAMVRPVSFFDITANDLLNSFTVNVISSLLLTRTIVPAMIDRSWGRIVNLSSIGVKFGGGVKTFCYSLSKHALEFFPQEHKSWSKSNVLINTLRVGVTDTRIHKIDPEKDMNKRIEMIPMGRMATPEEIANTVYWLGSDQNTFMTGQVIATAGGE